MEDVVGVLRTALPAPVGVGYRAGGAEAVVAHPDEEAQLSPRAVPRRRAEYRLGRAAARQALLDLGAPPEPVGRAADGRPRWPEGIVGSIAHAGARAVAVVGWRRDHAALGVDLESPEPGLSADAAPLVLSPDEIAWAAGSGPRRTAAFSAKEALYKALYPLALVRLDLADLALTAVGEGTFTAAVRGWPDGAPRLPEPLVVHWRLVGGAVLAWARLPPAG